MAGAFDRMGYLRQELLDNTKDIYDFYADNIEYTQRTFDQKLRTEENAKKTQRLEEIANETKLAKALVKKFKKDKIPCPQGLVDQATRLVRLREMRKQIRDSGLDPEETLTYLDLKEYNESLWLRKKPELKLKEEPKRPELTRTKQVKITVQQLMEQADYIGCYLEKHPAPVLYPDTTRINTAEEGDYLGMAGQITSYKEITTRRGQQMAFLEMGDGTGIAELILFPRQWSSLSRYGQLPEVGDIVSIECEVETVTDTSVKVIVNRLKKYQPVKQENK
jgi:DNA polymerase III alpha subunit